MATGADRGDARLLHAISFAESEGDPLAWIDASVNWYSRRRARGGSETDLAAVREDLLAHADLLRSGLRSRVGRLWAGQVVDQAIGELLRDLLEQPDPDPAEVFRLAESAKARTLLDVLDGRFQGPTAEAAESLAAGERELLHFGEDEQRGLVFTEMRLASELGLGGGQISRASLRDSEAGYAADGSGFSGVAGVAAPERVCAALAPRELLIEYVIPYHPLHPAFGVWILAAVRDGMRLLATPVGEQTGDFIGRIKVDDRAPLDASPLGNAITTLRDAIQRGDDAGAGAGLRSLHANLVAPLIDAGLDPAAFDLVTIIPHRMLHPVPWAALADGDGRRLIDRTALALAPSATTWLALRERARPLKRSCLALANPPLVYAGADPLPNAEDEIAQVARAIEADGVATDPLVGPAASETALVERASGHGIVYLATHGAFPENDALDFHHLLLARTRRHDGVVSADAIRLLDLSETWLVVLSICDGGLYRFGPGDEPQGLLPAFLAAGSQNVIGTLWQIADRAGRDLMVRAAPYLVSHGPAEALRRAMLDVSRDPAVPVRDWAGFVVTGTGGAAP